MRKPNLNTIIENNLDKTKFQSKAQPSLPEDGWLSAYKNGGTYISDRAQATQFGQYAEGGSSWMLTNPNRMSTFFPRMNNGGGLLSRTVTCSNCGHSWKGVTGGLDPLTCHKCGGMIKMQQGGLTKYQSKGQVTKTKKEPYRSNMHNYENALMTNVHPYLQSQMELAKNRNIKKGIHNGPLDAIRHAGSAAGASSEVFPFWVPPSLKVIGANVLGAAHEFTTPGKIDWKETGSDLYNNFIGSIIGALPISNYKKQQMVIDAQNNGVLSNINSWRNGGDISIPNLQEGNWLKKYDVGGFTVTDETTKPKKQYGCKGKSCTQTGDGIKKVGVRDMPEDGGGGSGGFIDYKAFNAPATWEELLTYNNADLDKKEAKQFNKDIAARTSFLQGQFPGLTQNQLLVAGADSARIRQRMGNLPRYDQPAEQTFDKAYHQFYRPLMNQATPVTIPQILQYQSQQPGGLQGFESTVRGNYGRPKAQVGLNISGVTDFKMPLNRTDATGLSIQEKQRQDAAALEMQRRNEATAKQQFIGTPHFQTLDEQRTNKQKKKQFVQNNPNTELNDQDEIVSKNPDRDFEGKPLTPNAKRWDKGLEHIMNALEATSALTGSGQIGSNLLRLGASALEKKIGRNILSRNLKNFTSSINPTLGAIDDAGAYVQLDPIGIMGNRLNSKLYNPTTALNTANNTITGVDKNLKNSALEASDLILGDNNLRNITSSQPTKKFYTLDMGSGSTTNPTTTWPPKVPMVTRGPVATAGTIGQPSSVPNRGFFMADSDWFANAVKSDNLKGLNPADLIQGRELGQDIAKGTGGFNKGVYDLERFPGYVIKFEDPEAISKAMQFPEYKNYDFVKGTASIEHPNIAKVHHQFTMPAGSGREGQTALIMNKVTGVPLSKLTPMQIRKIPKEAIEELYNNFKKLRNNKLGFDFQGDNLVYDPRKKQFGVYDIESNFMPQKGQIGFWDWNKDVLGGSNLDIYGVDQSGQNLKDALLKKIKRNYDQASDKFTNDWYGSLPGSQYSMRQSVTNGPRGSRTKFLEAISDQGKLKAADKVKDILAAMHHYRRGGMITDPMGQWAHPGQNTRIPGNNITMQGVPYPVLAKASNGMTRMMYPGQQYSFPGANHVDEYPLPMAQDGLISFLPQQDPEMTYRDRFNTPLNKRQTKRFNEWAAEESERQGRNIMMDKGAYDVQGFWKSGDYKKMDKDNHGTDTWKKPNHPTFSNQSRYHGVDGFYGGNWTPEAGYQPSKQTVSSYGPSYYNWMFGLEPNRPEHLDASRYTSGANAPSPLYYKNGGLTQYQTKGEVTYTHERGTGGLNYSPIRTVSPYLSNRDIRRYTQAPTSGKDVNFIANYGDFKRSFGKAPQDYNPTSIPYEGSNHWNINRFIVDPHLNDSFRDLNVNASTPEERRASILADMYKYNMLQDPEHKGRAFRQAKRFVRREIDPMMNGAFLNDFLLNQKGTPNFNLMDPMNTFDEQNPLVSLNTWNRGMTEEDMKKQHPDYNPSEWTADRMKNISMDYLTNYKKMSKRDAKKQWKTWEEDAAAYEGNRKYQMANPGPQRTKTIPKEWANLSDDDLFYKMQDLPEVGETGWNIEYFDPTAKKTQTKHFATNREAEEFYNNPANKASAKYSDASSVGRMQNGGWLKKYQDGNQVTYTVKKGDTLSQIGKQFGMTPQQIADANNISNIDFIRTNQKLNIPGATIPQQPAVGPTDVPIAPVQFQNTLPSFVQTQPTVQGNYIASPDTSINIKNNPEIYSELDPEISSIISNYTTPSTLDSAEDTKKRETARRIVEIARKHIAMGKEGYFEVPADIAAASRKEGKEPAGCVGGACKIAQEAGAMPKIFWSNTAFTKAAPELGFPNKGYGLRGIQNLEAGDFMVHQTELGGYDDKGNPKYIPRHTQIFLGINPETKQYEFFDNFHKRLMSYPESEIKDKLKQTKNSYDYGAVIYKNNPFHPTTNSYTDETVQQAADKELFVKEQMKNPSKYKYSIRSDAKDYNNSTKGIMNTFVNYANDDKNITDLVSKLKVGKDEIHDSLLNVFGELGQENNWSNSGKGLKSKAENVAEKVLTFFGGAKRYSVGPGQNKFSTIPEDLREQFGIKSPKDLYDINKVIPLMVAEDIRNKQVLRRWGQQNVLSHKLIGHTDKENPLRADDLKGGVGRWSPYLRNEFGLISSGKRVINNNDLIPWNGEDVTWDNWYKPGAGKLVSNYDMNAGMFMNPRTLAEGSYPDKVFHKTDDNLQRTLITPNTETSPDTLPTKYVFSKAKKKKEFGGQNNWLNNYR